MTNIKAGDHVNFVIVKQQGRNFNLSKRKGKVKEVFTDRNRCSISYRGTTYFRSLDEVEIAGV